MKKSSSSNLARDTICTLFLMSGLMLLSAASLFGRTGDGRHKRPVAPIQTVTPAAPFSGSVGPAPGGPSAAWQGMATAPGGGVNTEAACVDGVNCELYTLTVLGVKADWTGQKVQVQRNWASNLNEYDLYIHQGPTTTSPLVTSVMAGPGFLHRR